MRRILKVLALVGLLLAAAGAVTACIYHWRPLIASDEWRAEWVKDGGSEAATAKVYAMFLRPSVLFVRLPEEAGIGRYEWFTVDWRYCSVGSPTGWPERRPYLHYNRDMALGIPLTSQKLGEKWEVVWGDDEVRFSKADLAVRVWKRTEGKK